MISHRTQVLSPTALLSSMPEASVAIQQSIAAFAAQAPKLRGSALLDMDVRPNKTTQREIMQQVYASIKDSLMHKLTLSKRARLRSNGGPGAGAFLMAPLAGGAAMPHGAWRIAARRQLLADVRAVVSPQVPATHCQHHSRDGGCGGVLTEDAAEFHIES